MSRRNHALGARLLRLSACSSGSRTGTRRDRFRPAWRWPEGRELPKFRDRALRGTQPRWRLSNESLERIEALSSQLPDSLAGRIVICELLNSFPSVVYPNRSEMHSSIKFGIRPLLYSLLRRQFIYPRCFSICANTECRNFFNIERSEQKFCSSECSLHHRQRVYWQERGKKLRQKRSAQRRKMRKRVAKTDARIIARKKTE